MPLKTLADFPLSAGSKEPSWIDKDVQALREKVISEKRMKCKTDDEFLLRFLRARKYDRERAFKMLKNYCSMRQRYPEVFLNLTPSAMMDILSKDTLIYLPKLDQNGRYIAIGRARLWDVSEVSLLDLIRLSHLLLESLILEDTLQHNGFILILDAKGINLRHLMQVTPRIVLLILNVFLDSFPVRYKAIHIVNSTKLTDLIVATFWPFLPSKFKQRICVHNTLESLQKHVDVNLLPDELGGKSGQYESSHCIERLLKQEEYFQEHQKSFLT